MHQLHYFRDPNNGQEVDIRIPKYEANQSQILNAAGDLSNWQVTSSVHADAALLWEEAAYTRDGINQVTQCREP